MDKNEQLKNFKPAKPVQVLKHFLVLCITLNLTVFAMLYLVEKNVIDIKREELESQQLEENEIIAKLLVDEFDFIISDVDFLVDRYSESISVDQQDTDVIKHGWETFSDARQIYDQIRFIDKNGNEKIRINLGKDGAYAVDEDALQNKADRYYFADSIYLSQGQVFISKMDLNIENGSIEIPNKPTVRFAAPVYSNDFEPDGVIVLNYLADGILDKFQSLPKPDRQKLYLLDANGYWLSSDNPMEEWTFMYDDKQDISFKNRFPDAWDQMQNNSGLVVTDDGMFVYSKLFIDDTFITHQGMIEEKLVLDEGSWIAVSYHPADGPNGYLFNTGFWDISRTALTDNKWNLIFMTLVSLVIAIFVYMNRAAKARVAYFSTYDSLTGAYNRRAGIGMLSEKMPKDSKRKCGISFIFLDVNGLKQVNDTLGHDFGDELIVTAASVVMDTIREDDILIRMGGDEFLIVLKQAFESDAELIWQRILQKFGEINDNESRPYLISVSHGIVAADSCQLKGVDDMIKIADERMYEEKRKMKIGLDVIRI